jgi:hypothetical protein
LVYLTPQPNRVLCHSDRRVDDPVIGFVLPFYSWLHMRRIDQLHRALGEPERELTQSADKSRFVKYQAQIAEIESAVRLLKVARPFEADLHRLRVHLHMVQEDVRRIKPTGRSRPPRKATMVSPT